MKNRIDSCFEQLNAKGEKALITFVTSGDPDLETTEKCVLEMLDKGADIIELGVPFSDPIAEGPVIQMASQRALRGGVTLDKIFDMVTHLRTKTDKPLLLMMYINTIFKYGTEKFFKKCRDHEIDGVIVPDLPFEERDEIAETADKYGVYKINLVAPTSADRVAMIAAESKGFLYVVSSLGVTGSRSEITTDFDKLLAPIKGKSPVPYCIGFGISNAEQSAKMASYSDGVIVGSAIVRTINENPGAEAQKAGELAAALKAPLRK